MGNFTRLEKFLPFSSISKWSSANSFSLVVSKICRLGKVKPYLQFLPISSVFSRGMGSMNDIDEGQHHPIYYEDWCRSHSLSFLWIRMCLFIRPCNTHSHVAHEVWSWSTLPAKVHWVAHTGIRVYEIPEKKKTFFFRSNQSEEDIIINGPTLLDVESVEVNTITISGNGKLVFGQGHSISIATKGILVKDNGALVIGSETCPHEDEVNIVLIGMFRLEYHSSQLGRFRTYIKPRLC